VEREESEMTSFHKITLASVLLGLSILASPIKSKADSLEIGPEAF
jgi:hypothetical protein